MKILVLNCGSSSLKFQIIVTDTEAIKAGTDVCLAKGVVERIGGQSLVTYSAGSKMSFRTATPLRSHKAAIQHALSWLMGEAGLIHSISEIEAIGHRIVHGGEKLTDSCLVDDAAIKQIEECIELAPLHNPANLEGIRAAIEVFGAGMNQVCVFDTAYHATMEEESFLYAIPYQYYRRHKIRKYGFHGSSHRYVQYKYRKEMGHEKHENHLISLHLGNGCSACAVKASRSIETSMGMTPIEGLMMGTRSGDIDPSIVEFLALKEGLSLDQVDGLLNKQSGLLGISGLTHDMRDLLLEVEEFQDRRAKLAVDMFVKRICKYIGAYLTVLDEGCKAIVFTGGIGENAAIIREKVCSKLTHLGVRLDAAKNKEVVGGKYGRISTADSKIDIMIIPTNEELIIARDTYRLVTSG